MASAEHARHQLFGLIAECYEVLRVIALILALHFPFPLAKGAICFSDEVAMRSLGPSFEPRIGLAESDLLMGLNRQGQLSEIV